MNCLRPSSADRWLNCAYYAREVYLAIKEGKEFPEGTAGAAAQRGTELHAALEAAIKIGAQTPAELASTFEQRLRHTLFTFEEFKSLRGAVRRLAAFFEREGCSSIRVLTEQRFLIPAIDFGELAPVSCMGTADLFIIAPSLRLGVLVDWKMGKIPVNIGSAQFRAYAKGAYAQFKDTIDDVWVYRVQPAANPSVVGRVYGKKKLQEQEKFPYNGREALPCEGSHCLFCPFGKECGKEQRSSNQELETFFKMTESEK